MATEARLESEVVNLKDKIAWLEDRLQETRAELQHVSLTRGVPWLPIATITAPILVALAGAFTALYVQSVELQSRLGNYNKTVTQLQIDFASHKNDSDSAHRDFEARIRELENKVMPKQ